jgi:cyclohexa-1,5-dienecarbonyl-CoA hydratase
MGATDADGLKIERREQGRVLHLLLDAPKGNVLDERMTRAIAAALETHGADPALRAIVFEGAGPNFCFGASVAEHTRERAASMLRTFHALFCQLSALAVPTCAIVRGACLGGGLELAAWCTWIFAAPDAQLGQPEIKLAVFPPMASLLLPWRLGAGRALDLCVSGRTIDATRAHAIGLVHEVAADPAAACARFVAANLLPRSGPSLRLAERAARLELSARLAGTLPALERLYLDELMATPDANEGIAAFLEKRAPRWENA